MGYGAGRYAGTTDETEELRQIERQFRDEGLSLRLSPAHPDAGQAEDAWEAMFVAAGQGGPATSVFSDSKLGAARVALERLRRRKA
jgi:hypothetical protein